ncbi:MAG: DUF362 domain-containing protein [Candidatus Aminicenantales bacterium]
MKKAKVSLVKLENYKPENVSMALKEGLDHLGGLDNIIEPHSRVFVKINHLSPPSPPEKAIVTHPHFSREVFKLLKDLKCDITVGDDIQAKGKDGFLVSGYREVCEEMGIRLVNLKEIGFQEVECRGQLLQKAYISPLLFEADHIVNLPKLKTHSFTVFTGAVKNMFGIIPYGLRLHYHRQYPRYEIFSQMLVDIFSCAPPHLTIMDAVVAMEGEGPSGGHSRRSGILLSGQDAVAVDAVASRIVGFNPEDIATTQNAHERGLGTGNLEEIEIIGLKIQDVELKDFKHSAIAVGFLRRRIPSSLYAAIQDQLVFIPEVRRDKCTQCLECVQICPSGAAKDEADSVRIDENMCIHCMCCHEVCRFQAIRLKQTIGGKIIRGLRSFYERMNHFMR